MRSPRHLPPDTGSTGFTLVELLSVVAIMAVVMGILAMSLSQSQSRGVQMAAAQVASGMGLARQLAVTKNTDARFIVAPARGDGTAGAFYPEEPYRYWAVVYSNRGGGVNEWVLAKDWEQLPAGTVFMNNTGQGYTTIGWKPLPSTIKIGEPYSVTNQANTDASWVLFNSFANMRITSAGAPVDVSGVPFIGFKPSGRATAANLGLARETVFSLGEGVVTPANQIILKSTNNITRVETDVVIGKITVRPRDSYR